MITPERELFPAKPETRLRLYAWSSPEVAERWRDCLKIGQTTQDVNTRIRQSQGQTRVTYTLEIDEPAERSDGTFITDVDVRRLLIERGFTNVVFASSREWVRCTPADVLSAIHELRDHAPSALARLDSFEMRDEQRRAVNAALTYYRSVWAENPAAIPEFLWNAKMRFGKTFSTYQLAKKLGATRVLVLTFKPAVGDAWKSDLESHTDFAGWRFASRATTDVAKLARDGDPLVYFASFQDVLGTDAAGNFKAKHRWLAEHTWDLVVFDEYHFGAWRDVAKELFEGESHQAERAELTLEFGSDLRALNTEFEQHARGLSDIIPLRASAYLYLSGTPFRALAQGRFIEEQIFNWTYADEQRAKHEFSARHPEQPNPYAALPEMRLLTYQMPDALRAIAAEGELDEFDLNTFFEARGEGSEAEFVHADEVQQWLNIVRGSHMPTQLDALRTGTRPPFPYADTRLLPYLQHSLWVLPRAASCAAMANLLAAKHNTFWHDYTVVNVTDPKVGHGLDALPPVREAIGAGFDTRTITLTVGKLTTGVTVPQWSSVLMLRNLQAPESYFQTAFRVQSPWTIRNPDGTDPTAEEVLKPVCYVFDFSPTRALRQISEYGIGLATAGQNPEQAVTQLVNFLPVLAYDGHNMMQIDAGEILDHALSGTTATMLARKWESALLVNVDDATLEALMRSGPALDAVMRIEGFRSLTRGVFETIVNRSAELSSLKKSAGDDATQAQRREFSAEERALQKLRRQVREKLVRFATRIPAFMYLTDHRENRLIDVIRHLEPELFKSVTGLSIEDFNLLVGLDVFNATLMDQAIFAFRRYEDASLTYTGINRHGHRTRIGLYDTVIEIAE